MAKQLFFVAMLLLTFAVAFATTALATGGGSAIRADQSPANIPSRKLQYRVCGYYCGPDWCANQVISEEECVAQGIWGIPASRTDNAVDGCCRLHDQCCGLGENRAACNRALIACIQQTNAYWTFCGALVWSAMMVASGWCCGDACPTYVDPNVPLTLAGKQFSDGIVRITFTTEESYIVEAVQKAEGAVADENGSLPASSLKLAASQSDSVCHTQTYALGKESLIVDLGPMMAVDTNTCGKKLMALGGAYEQHPLLDSPETVVYWPHADIIAVNQKTGGVLMMNRVK